MLTEEQQQIRDTARAFAQEQLVPNGRGWDRGEGVPPRDVFAAMGKLGFMGMCVPEQWGGAATDFTSYVVALEEIAAGDGGVSTVMSVNNSPVAAAINTYGTAEQKARFLTPLVRGDWNGAFCLTEPQAGSDASSLKTRAVLDGNKWVLNGTKQFITSGSTSGVALVFAVTDSDKAKRGITCFLVPTDSKGWTVARLEEKSGQRASDTCQIVLDNVAVTPDLILGARGEGYKIALANLESGRIGIAAQAIGMARAAFEAALEHAKTREAFGQAIIKHQAVSFRLADMATRIEAARRMMLHAAALKDAGRPCLKEASMAKLFASEMAETVCSDAIQVHGGYGYLKDYPVERIWRDVRVCQIYEGTSDVQRMVIARALAT